MTDPDVNDSDLAEIEYILQETDEMIQNGPRYMATSLEEMASVHQTLLDASESDEDTVGYNPGTSFLAAIDLGQICLGADDLDDFADEMIDLMEGAPRPTDGLP